MNKINKTTVAVLILFLCLTKLTAQEKVFPKDPQDAKLETSDIENFWKAFDSMDSSNGNPFELYIKNGTVGLQGFIQFRIINADSMLNMVKRRKQDYEKIRGIEAKIKEVEKRIKPYFYALEYWYPYSVYPPVYFVVGRFNSGGTTSENGLLIGAEKLTSLDHLPELIIHESIHFQQKWPEGGQTNLLQQSILEGMADFIAELVTGIKGNQEANKYGNEHKEELCREFVGKMHGNDMQDWLYQTSGKDNRPNDLGYWIGYEIVKAYFDKANDKKLAVNHILNIEDYDRFLKESGYLKKYMD
ncbi:gliding motility protein GldB-related protein [Psychroserpens sp. BH13MA-6]